MKEKFLIVNADDAGLAIDVNAGIERAIREGIARSTSIMATGAGFDDAVEKFRAIEGLSIGIHLVGTLQKPVLDPAKIPTITDESGRLLRSPLKFLLKMAKGKVKLEEVEMEFRAQIEKILSAGIKLTHLDSHLHMHGIPGVLGRVLRLAKEKKIRFVRNLTPKLPGNTFTLFTRNPRHLTHHAMAAITTPILRARLKSFPDILNTDETFSFVPSGMGFKEQLINIIESIKPGLSEFLCHPGTEGTSTSALPFRYPGWEKELEALIDPEIKKAVGRCGIKLISYNEAGKDRPHS